MSPSVSGIDSKELGEAEIMEVTQADAEAALLRADMPGSAELVNKVKERATVGRFIAGQTAGFIVANCALTIDRAERVMRVLDEKIFKGAKTTNRQLIDATKAMATMMQATEGQEALQLKAAEAIAYGKKKTNRSKNAPTQINGTAIIAENVQVNAMPTGNK